MVNLKRTIADWMASQPFIGISPTNSEVINSVRVIDIHLQSLEVLGRMYIETRKNVYKKKMAKICEMVNATFFEKWLNFIHLIFLSALCRSPQIGKCILLLETRFNQRLLEGFVSAATSSQSLRVNIDGFALRSFIVNWCYQSIKVHVLFLYSSPIVGVYQTKTNFR